MNHMCVRRDEGSDDSDEGSGRKRRGLFDDDFFETEFKKRRKVRRGEIQWLDCMKMCSHCRLPQRQNTKHQVKSYIQC